MKKILVLALALMAGCTLYPAPQWRSCLPWPTPPDPVDPEPPVVILPTNPVCPPDLPGTRSESWDFSRKDAPNADQTWRPRFPATCGKPPFSVGPGSFCTINGNSRAEWRGMDADSDRPSFTMPLSVPVVFPARVILHDTAGKPIAWFDAPGPNSTGKLP